MGVEKVCRGGRRPQSAEPVPKPTYRPFPTSKYVYQSIFVPTNESQPTIVYVCPYNGRCKFGSLRSASGSRVFLGERVS